MIPPPARPGVSWRPEEILVKQSHNRRVRMLLGRIFYICISNKNFKEVVDLAGVTLQGTSTVWERIELTVVLADFFSVKQKKLKEKGNSRLRGTASYSQAFRQKWTGSDENVLTTTEYSSKTTRYHKVWLWHIAAGFRRSGQRNAAKYQN